MDKELMGIISGALVVASGVPYAVRAYQKKIRPNITSWALWSAIGLVLLLTYKSSGAQYNAWPAVFGFTNPTVIAAIAVWRRGEWEPMTKWEAMSIIGCLASLSLWWEVRGQPGLAQYALYLAMAADLCAAIPTVVFVWTTPDGDRPVPWAMFAFAYGLAVFAVTDPTFANYILPVYMFFGAMAVALPLAAYRVRARIPAAEWI